jgi:membrane associated rhomboid family serine protease
MLSDRSYMRDSYGRQTTSVLTWIMCGLVAGFILQKVFELWLPPSADFEFIRFAVLSPATLFKEFFLWTLVSHTFLHVNVLHAIVNGLLVFFLGRELLPVVGQRRLGWLYAAAAVVGGLLWFAIHQGRDGYLIGSSSVVCAFLILFACLNPNREIQFLVFFVLPVTLRPKVIAWIVLAVDLVGFFFSELPGHALNLPYAPSAHLGGMLAGLLYYRFIHLREWQTPDGRADIELPQWFRKSQKAPVAVAPKFKVQITTREDLRAEVDRILDKINSDGFGALTIDEKRVLDDAKDLLSRP